MFAPLESTRVEAQVWRICGTWRCCGGPGGASWCAALSPHADPAARRRRRSFRSPSRSLARARPPARAPTRRCFRPSSVHLSDAGLKYDGDRERSKSSSLLTPSNVNYDRP